MTPNEIIGSIFFGVWIVLGLWYAIYVREDVPYPTVFGIVAGLLVAAVGAWGLFMIFNGGLP